jgi:hypothetical protein
LANPEHLAKLSLATRRNEIHAATSGNVIYRLADNLVEYPSCLGNQKMTCQKCGEGARTKRFETMPMTEIMRDMPTSLSIFRQCISLVARNWEGVEIRRPFLSQHIGEHRMYFPSLASGDNDAEWNANIWVGSHGDRVGIWLQGRERVVDMVYGAIQNSVTIPFAR